MSDNFGSAYEAVEYAVIAPTGDHMVQLGMPKIEIVGKPGNQFRVVKIPVFIDNYPNHSPDSWTMFDAPHGDVEKMVKWNKSMTQFFDAFGIARGDFAISEWSGKRGRVRIQPDTGGYAKVAWAIAGFAGKEYGTVPYEKAEPKKPAQRGSNAFTGNQNAGDPLPDDIPQEGF